MNVNEIGKKLDDALGKMKVNMLKALEIEAKKSIAMNFNAGGRPKWEPSIKRGKAKGTKTLRISGNMSKTSAVRDEASSSITFYPNPLARAYSRIHHEGGTINHPGRKLKFVKNKSGRTVFGKDKRKRGVVKEVQGKSYTIRMPARPWLVIPPEDYPRILSSLARAAKF